MKMTSCEAQATTVLPFELPARTAVQSTTRRRASSYHLLQREADQDLVDVGEVADDLAHGVRQFDHQRRDRDNLIAARLVRVFEDVDHLDLIAALEVILAEHLEIGEGANRLRGLSRD